MQTVDYQDYKKVALQNEKLKKEYDALKEEFLLATEIIQLREEKKWTQKELAKKIGTSQPAIARLESGNYKNVSLAFIRKLAAALDAVPEIHLKRKAN
jgi:predicted transcriptional regulator